MKVMYDFIDESDHIISEMEKQCHWGQFNINGKTLTRTGSFEGQYYIREEIDGESTLVKIIPWLRCPSIENQTIYPMSDIITDLIEEMNKKMGATSNIAKIQKYEDGNVDIKPHSDKILDLKPGSSIYLIRFGAKRTAILQHKVTKEIRRIEMPHNTLLILSYQDNLEWTHSIEKDSKITEPSYSIVFRNSVTFLEPNLKIVYGQHTPFKTKNDIHRKTNKINSYYTKEKQREELVKMYNKENNNVIRLEDYSEIMKKAIFP